MFYQQINLQGQLTVHVSILMAAIPTKSQCITEYRHRIIKNALTLSITLTITPSQLQP